MCCRDTSLKQIISCSMGRYQDGMSHSHASNDPDSNIEPVTRRMHRMHLLKVNSCWSDMLRRKLLKPLALEPIPLFCKCSHVTSARRRASDTLSPAANTSQHGCAPTCVKGFTRSKRATLGHSCAAVRLTRTRIRIGRHLGCNLGVFVIAVSSQSLVPRQVRRLFGFNPGKTLQRFLSVARLTPSLHRLRPALYLHAHYNY